MQLLMSHVIYIDGSCHTYEGAVTHMNVLCDIISMRPRYVLCDITRHGTVLCDIISMRHATAAQHRGGGGAGTQCVAVCCSVLQSVAVCCSVLRGVAVFYSSVQCGARGANTDLHTESWCRCE